MNFKKLINKLVSTKDEKPKKEVKNVYEFDTVPDAPRSDSELSSSSVPKSSSDNNSGYFENDRAEDFKTNNDDPGTIPTKPDRKPEQEDESNFSSNHKEEFFGESHKSNSTGASNIQHTNMVFNGCSKIQIGNTYNQVNVGKLINSQPTQKPAARQKTFMKTEAVKGLLKSKDVLETAHINCLSTHFGSKWRDIGTILELTGGELDSIKEHYEGHQERGFQMLKIWWQKKGEQVTVGQLCKRLWNADLDVAKEAVHKLSLNIENLK